MSIFVIGAHGQIGQMLTKELHQSGKDVVASVRNETQAAEFAKLGIASRTFNLLSMPDTMEKAFKGIGTIVFTAGSGGKTGYDATLNIDLDGAVKTMIAAKKAGVSHYIMVSAIGMNDREFWVTTNEQPYFAAKYYADDWLIHRSELNYTILRPGILTNDIATGKVDFHPNVSNLGTITREDVAAIIAHLVDCSGENQIIEATNGLIPIDKAIEQLK